MESTNALGKIVFVGDSQSGKTSLIREIKGLGQTEKKSQTIVGELTSLTMIFDDVIFRLH